jgi:hypothetical protein
MNKPSYADRRAEQRKQLRALATRTFLEEIQSRLKRCSQIGMAREWGISPQYLNDLLRGRRRFTPQLLSYFRDGHGLYHAQASEQAEREWVESGAKNGTA